MPNASPIRWKKWLIAAIKLLIVALVVWFIRGTIVDAWRELGKHRWHFDYAWLTLAGLFYAAGVFVCGVFWHRVLRALGQEAGLAETLRAYYIGHLGKYVPGKAMVVILRTGLIRSHRVDTTLAAASVFFETLTMMAVGAFLGAGVVAVFFREETLLFWGAVAMMLASGVPTFPPVFQRVVRLVVKLAGISHLGGADIPVCQEYLDHTGRQECLPHRTHYRQIAPHGDPLTGIGYGITLVGWILCAIGWVLLGLSLWAVLRGMGVVTDSPIVLLYLYTAAVSLATVVGFVSFVPGGQGSARVH